MWVGRTALAANLMVHLQRAVETACLAALRDGPFLAGHLEVRFRVVTLRAQDKLANESVQQILQLIGIVRAIDDEAFVLPGGTTIWKSFQQKTVKLERKKRSEQIGE